MVKRLVRLKDQTFSTKLNVLSHVGQWLLYRGAESWGRSLGPQGEKDKLLPLPSVFHFTTSPKAGRAE